MNDLPNISAIALHVVCCRLSCCLVGRALKPNSSLLHQTCERFHCKTSRSSCFTRPSFDLHMLAVLSCLSFRSRHTGAAHSSAWFRATPAENHFAKPPLDLSISVSSLLSLFPLGANGRRAFKRNSMLSRSSYGAFLCKASLRSPHMLSVCFCLYFCAGWTGAAHSSATQCFRAATAEHCFAKPPLDLSICCQFSSVLISARGGRASRIQAQLNVFAPHLRRIALQSSP